jgi:glycosyltransferase involved in cell wall biosynthesis
MKILQVNKFFYVRGGSERYFFDLCDLLMERGHEVIHFSMRHPRNEESGQDAYFVDEIDFNGPLGVAGKAGAALRIVYYREGRARFRRLIEHERPDVVHFHNITRQLSPSIIDAAAASGIPMVQTLHDLSLVCPAHSFFVNDRACEDCSGGRYWHAMPARCIDGSVTSSLLGVLEAYVHSWLGLYKKIDRFIAPSLFLKSKVESLDWMVGRITHLPYFIPPAPDYTRMSDGYALFAGRISKEKGVGTLIEAAARLRSIRFVVAGEGPPLEDFRAHAASRGITNIEFVGYVKGEALETLIARAGCIVVPSISYENLPLSILEAFARGKPVVASDCGGIPELVMDGVTGYLFDPHDPGSLAAALEKTLTDEQARLKMGRQARELTEGDYSPGYHFDRLMNIYGDLRQ